MVRRYASIIGLYSNPGLITSGRIFAIGAWHGEIDALQRLVDDGLIVTDGVAHCWGAVRSEEERQAILAAAARVPGVKGVKDHLEYSVAFTPM
ncbi:BON domain-containing protein [Paraburkholderia tuberum]|uniref:BON domain-containing protein n=1 Tax=Paraburkholderia tuberum TaxID=157910 RepID=UPI001FC8A217|nr:BON domain-containing protein [Paraburkholderia tuberum]